MNYYTKKKIKNWFKAKWKWLLGSGIFLTAGLVVMLVGFSITGWSLIKWLQSPYAVTTFVFVGFGAFLSTMAFLIRKNIDLVK